MNAYQRRNALLVELGYNSYADYLASPLWQKIRRKVLKAHGHKCGLCCQKATEVHHIRYTREALLGHGLLHYVPVCRECHKKHEFDGDFKVSLDACNEAMKRTFLARMASKKRQKSTAANRAERWAQRASNKHFRLK